MELGEEIFFMSYTHDASGIFRVFIHLGMTFTWMLVCCCCYLMMFSDWSDCVMSVFGTTKHSLCMGIIDT